MPVEHGLDLTLSETQSQPGAFLSATNIADVGNVPILLSSSDAVQAEPAMRSVNADNPSASSATGGDHAEVLLPREIASSGLYHDDPPLPAFGPMFGASAEEQLTPEFLGDSMQTRHELGLASSEDTLMLEWEANARFDLAYLDWFDLTLDSAEEPAIIETSGLAVPSEIQKSACDLAVPVSSTRQPELYSNLNYPNTYSNAALLPDDQTQHHHQDAVAGGNTSLTQYPGLVGSSNPRQSLLRQFQTSEQLRKLMVNGRDISAVLEGFMYILSGDTLPSLRTLNSQFFLSYNLLEQFLDLYKTQFQPILPIIHLPSWDRSIAPSVLVSAMACIGAKYSTIENVSALSKGLGLICSIGLMSVAGPDMRGLSHHSHFAAACLHQIHALGSGDRQIYDNAEAGRGALLSLFRRAGLFKPHTQLRPEDQNNAYSEAGDDHRAQDSPFSWQRWRDSECDLRLAWAIFEYDCTLSTLTNRRGTIDVHEAPDRLPCAETLWEAHSSQMWRALASVKSMQLTGPRLPLVLQQLVSQKNLTRDVTSWSRRLCSQVLTRQMWDLKRIETAYTPDFLNLPQLFHMHQPANTILLRALTFLRNSMKNPISASDLVHTHVTYLLCHHAHLFTSNSGLHLIVHLFSNFFQEAHEVQRKQTHALQQRLRNLLQRDPIRTRRLTWHAAQIVGIAHENAVHALCKTTLVFTGYLYLLTSVRYGNLQSNCDFDPPVQLDRLPWCQDSEEGAEVETWIEMGGPAAVGSVSNLCDKDCFQTLKANAIQTIQDLKTWQLNQKFCKIIDAFPW
ncbi:uncharacterized protein A1O9_00038 [Exophiala aquamarina CBS 119918]|uniref:Xylanolytic transcriptional activator regulatory domain-containing protein n=1 Tax=Exophiala aquamarina CBS 119918 TaxID=1182545 RepID=A0A072PQA5_9EURO|nr:uncharacterized protein A1O9_00038 [Exophiala aquamarina CBS 119918]KEF62066.1 hypothetical protein A1O9_00038 [Exophiala aquamarina CBS 119918]